MSGVSGQEQDEPAPESFLSKQDYSGYEPPVRPASVTGAAVVAFILAALQVYGSFSAFAAAAVLAKPASHAGVLYFLGITGIIVSALLLSGGITAMRGTTRRILFVTSAIVAVVTGIDLLFGNFLAIIMLSGAVLIIVLLNLESSRGYFP
jgi:hypothetical protein